MFANVLAAEQAKVFKRRILWVQAAILMVASLFILAVSYAVTTTPEQIQDITWPGSIPLLLRQFTNMAGLFVVVLVASVVAQEYGWRNLHLMLSRGVPRTTLLLAKFAAIMLPVLVIVVAPLLVGIPVTALFTVWIHGSVDPAQLEAGRLALGLLAGVYTLLPYAAGAFALAIISRSTVTAIGAAVAFTLVENIGLQLMHEMSGVAVQISQFFPAMLISGVRRGLTPPAASRGATIAQPIEYLDPLPAALMVAVYIAAFLLLAGYAFKRQDLAG
jgi:ABC-type transport system involved in multi-copper enzyme maturation permease subunit